MKRLNLEYYRNELNAIEYMMENFENSILLYNPLIEFDIFIYYIEDML